MSTCGLISFFAAYAVSCFIFFRIFLKELKINLHNFFEALLLLYCYGNVVYISLSENLVSFGRLTPQSLKPTG
jgi:hypothetical protein